MTDERYVDFEAEDSIDIKAFLVKCFHQWYYFAAFLFVALLIAMAINRFTSPVYKVTTFLLIRDEENPLDPQNFVGRAPGGLVGDRWMQGVELVLEEDLPVRLLDDAEAVGHDLDLALRRAIAHVVERHDGFTQKVS